MRYSETSFTASSLLRTARAQVSVNPWAINQGVATLKSASAISLDQARQLRFVIHFVGDLHQVRPGRAGAGPRRRRRRRWGASITTGLREDTSPPIRPCCFRLVFPSAAAAARRVAVSPR
jgi:hypothetical protein